ncbi:MAG: TrkA family potassium uptake protein [Acidimicrobiia bacterium]
MHFVVVGCGRVGKNLTKYLLDRGHSVSLIDKNPDSFRKVERNDNLSTLIGIGYDKEVLESARIKEADGLAAVTSGDNSNIVIARIAKEIYGVNHVTARIYDSQRASLYQRLGISTVASVSWTTDQFIKRIAPENDTTDWVDPSGNVVIIERLMPKHWAGKNLSSLFEKDKFTPIAISHIGNTSVVSQQTKAHEDDRIFIACNKDRIEELDTLLSDGADE